METLSYCQLMQRCGELEAQVKQLAAERDVVVAEMALVKQDYATIPEVKSIGWPKTTNTDAILASLRAEAITHALENSSEYLDTDCVMDRHDISYQDAELRAAGAMELRDSLVAVAKQLRSKSEGQHD